MADSAQHIIEEVLIICVLSKYAVMDIYSTNKYMVRSAIYFLKHSTYIQATRLRISHDFGVFMTLAFVQNQSVLQGTDVTLQFQPEKERRATECSHGAGK